VVRLAAHVYYIIDALVGFVHLFSFIVMGFSTLVLLGIAQYSSAELKFRMKCHFELAALCSARCTMANAKVANMRRRNLPVDELG
jgi:hypothetical protein